VGWLKYGNETVSTSITSHWSYLFKKFQKGKKKYPFFFFFISLNCWTSSRHNKRGRQIKVHSEDFAKSLKGTVFFFDLFLGFCSGWPSFLFYRLLLFLTLISSI
jgi:hypothetical protein